MAMILNDLPSRGDAFSVHKGINHDELVRLTCSAGSGASDGRQTPAEASCPLKDLRTVPVFELNRRNQIRIAANHSTKRTGGRAHIGSGEIFFSGGNRASLTGASDSDLIAKELFRDFGIVHVPDSAPDNHEDLEEGVQLIRSDTKNSLLRLLERSNNGRGKQKRKADSKTKTSAIKRYDTRHSLSLHLFLKNHLAPPPPLAAILFIERASTVCPPCRYLRVFELNIRLTHPFDPIFRVFAYSPLAHEFQFSREGRVPILLRPARPLRSLPGRREAGTTMARAHLRRTRGRHPP